MDAQRLNALLDDRLRHLREAAAHIADIQGAWAEQAPAGARFVAGFGALLASVAADYIETNRHLLVEAARRLPATAAGAGACPAERQAQMIKAIGNLV